LLEHSVALKPGERLLIQTHDQAAPLACALVAEAHAREALPYVDVRVPQIERALRLGMTEEHAKQQAVWDTVKMEAVDALIQVVAQENDAELSDVPQDRQRLHRLHYHRPVMLDIVVAKKKWCLLGWPTSAMAQSAGMSTEAFTDFYFRVCTVDYARMARAMEPLAELMERTDRVRITGPGTDLRFSIKGLPAIKCAGENNIPDGEVFTAPVRESVEGVISFNTPSTERGVRFADVRLRFAAGKVVEATANDTAKLNEILDTDEGARYAGEFAIGVNPYIEQPMNDTLFDEKIKGSIHFTPGNAYEDCNNGNKSAVHWDLVAIQRPEYGGGELWFDEVLVRKDGRFVLPELLALNPENLIGPA
jgi:aminopeptidase